MTVTKNIDNFSCKLQQRSVIHVLKNYVNYRSQKGSGCSFDYAPISVNLDVTTSCNYECPHCVDSDYLNLKDKLTSDEVIDSISSLKKAGTKSIILIGGGEPTISPFFVNIVQHIKLNNLQLGIVSNGSNPEKLKEVAPLLAKGDWIRYSLDAAHEATYYDLHLPRKKTSLQSIVESVDMIKEVNSSISFGFSFIIFWQDIYINKRLMRDNIEEMVDACELAIQHNFDYISYKPCLVKDKSTDMRESLFFDQSDVLISSIREKIETKLNKVNRIAQGKIKVNASANLRALLNNNIKSIKNQPKVCHAQFIKAVLSPIGVYHCPAFRGDNKAKIGEKDGYCSKHIKSTLRNNLDKLDEFDASRECKDIACFYHDLNWWIEGLINGDFSIDDVEVVDDDNFFF